jgi:hypothetical protein
LNVTDIDVGDIKYYKWALNNITSGNLTFYNFTTNYSSSGIYNLTVVVSDLFNLSTMRSWKISVVKNSIPIVINVDTTDLTPVLKPGEAENFSVSATDIDGDLLSYNWYLNGTNVSNNKTAYLFNSTTAGRFNLTVIASDAAGNSAKTFWNITVTTIPVATSFSEQTTNFSNVNLSTITNLLFNNNFGNISFGEQTMNLTNALDLDDNVKIQNDLVAINSTRYPELGVSAKITLRGISYNSIPEIFYSNIFTTDPNQINLKCDSCNITNYTSFPTTNGTVTFEIPHFSSFKVASSGIIYDLSLFKALDLCNNGTKGNLNLDISSPQEGDTFYIGDKMDANANIENIGNISENIISEFSLYDVTRNQVKQKLKSDALQIKSDDNNDFKTSFNISTAIKSDDKYVLFVKSYKRNNEDSECVQGAVGVDIEQKDNSVVIKDVILNPDDVRGGDNFQVLVNLQNIGSNDENVYIEIVNDKLNIDEKSQAINLGSFGQDDTNQVIAEGIVPQNSSEGIYDLDVRLFSDGKMVDERMETINVLKMEIFNSSQITGNAINLGESNAKYSNSNDSMLLSFLIFGAILLSILIAMILIKK